MARSGFAIVMWGAPERAPATAWAPRVAGVLGALEEYAGVSRFVRYERRVPHAVASDEQSVLAFLGSHPTNLDDAGVPQPDEGIRTTLIGLDERDDEEPLPGLDPRRRPALPEQPQRPLPLACRSAGAL